MGRIRPIGRLVPNVTRHRSSTVVACSRLLLTCLGRICRLRAPALSTNSTVSSSIRGMASSRPLVPIDSKRSSAAGKRHCITGVERNGPCPLRMTDVVVVLDIVLELVHLDRAEASLVHQLFGLLSPPHGAESFAALCQGHGHAVQARDCVEHRAERMVAVEMDPARAFDVLRHVDAALGEREADAPQDAARVRLVVDGVERRNQVEAPRLPRRRFGKAAEVPLLEGYIRVALIPCLLASEGDRLPGKVVTDEAAVREPAGHQIEGLAAYAADVKNADA